MAPSTLFLCAELVAGAKVLAALQQKLGSLQGVSVLTGAASLLDDAKAVAALTVNTQYDVVWSVSFTAGFFTPTRLGRVASLVKPGGQVIVQEPGQGLEGLRKAVTFSGLQDCEASAALTDGASALSAKKPNWDAGAKQALRKPPPQQKVWTVMAEDNEDEIMDDNELLTEEDVKRPVVDANDDCDIGKGGKKACKNCTCGRAEGQTITEEQLNNPQSSCGSCYLGDAFRCGTCPYRGLPAFKPGEKITLPSDIVDA